MKGGEIKQERVILPKFYHTYLIVAAVGGKGVDEGACNMVIYMCIIIESVDSICRDETRPFALTNVTPELPNEDVTIYLLNEWFCTL